MFSYQEQGERTIDAGKRCAITASEWLPRWWVSYPDPADVYSEHHPDCGNCADDPTKDPTP